MLGYSFITLLLVSKFPIWSSIIIKSSKHKPANILVSPNLSTHVAKFWLIWVRQVPSGHFKRHSPLYTTGQLEHSDEPIFK